MDAASPTPGTPAHEQLEQLQKETSAQGFSEAVQLQGSERSMSSGQQGETELHRFCAEGKLDEVRAVLSKSLDGVESLDAVTGCTPIVLAIRNNHVEVVRELLLAGAVIPPPGLTSDPLLLSILYPQPLYGMPPPFMSQSMSLPSDFLPQQGFFPGQDGQRGMYPPFQHQSSRKDTSPNVHANLPPTDVAKTIPCRNYPNCKYGAGCVFYHPQPLAPAFYAGAQPFSNRGYDQPYAPFTPNHMNVPAPYYVPNNASMPFQSPHNGMHIPSPVQPQQQQPQSPQDDQHEQQRPQTPTRIEIPEASITQHDQIPSPSVPSAIAPPFVPASSIPQNNDFQIAPASHFGLSPISPSVLATSPVSVSPAEAFFGASPPNGQMMTSPIGGPNAFLPGMNGTSHYRRQSLNPQPFGMPGKPFGHGKKLSFSGVPRPFGPGRTSIGGGSWKDGNPPPCAFFGQGKCRNGELCKFPHLDAEGNDCRHPDVVRGIIPPLPTLSRQPRAMRAMNASFGSFDPSFRQQQHMQYLQHQQQYPEQAQQDIADPTLEVVGEGGNTPAETASKPTLPPSVPPKPVAVPTPTMGRSISQPGAQRILVNGIASRDQSPAPSNVSFHGNGHPRRAGSRASFANGTGHEEGRSVSAGVSKTAPQRVPGASDFPALSGSTSPNLDKHDSSGHNGKTAAQVLSLPAPPKPVTAKAVSPISHDSDDNQSISMESEPDSDAIIVSRRPSNASTPIPASSPPAGLTRSQRGSISFATAGLITNTMESPSIRVKA